MASCLRQCIESIDFVFKDVSLYTNSIKMCSFILEHHLNMFLRCISQVEADRLGVFLNPFLPIQSQEILLWIISVRWRCSPSSTHIESLAGEENSISLVYAYFMDSWSFMISGCNIQQYFFLLVYHCYKPVFFHCNLCNI